MSATAAGALARFVEVWSDRYTLDDIAGKLTRSEMEALAYLLVAGGVPGSAGCLVESWISAEIADGECEEGHYVEVDGALAVVEGHDGADGCAACESVAGEVTDLHGSGAVWARVSDADLAALVTPDPDDWRTGEGPLGDI